MSSLSDVNVHGDAYIEGFQEHSPCVESIIEGEEDEEEEEGGEVIAEEDAGERGEGVESAFANPEEKSPGEEEAVVQAEAVVVGGVKKDSQVKKQSKIEEESIPQKEIEKQRGKRSPAGKVRENQVVKVAEETNVRQEEKEEEENGQRAEEESNKQQFSPIKIDKVDAKEEGDRRDRADRRNRGSDRDGDREGGKASVAEQRRDNKVVSNAKWQNLQNLQNLLNAGFITKTEYRDRKSQLIDELTGTTISTATMSTAATRRPSTATEITVVPKAPPDFTLMLPESATKHVYDLAARKWSSSKVRIKLDTVPFAKGGLRLVYHMQELDCDETEGTYVAKLSMDANDRNDQDIYFRDVEMQSVAKYYAKLFNEYNPPKKVDFVKAWLLQLDDREGSPLCGVEKFIDGPYRKHNNNFGFVSDDERNTPQSFSHFSYESSNHGLLVCDIQGVSDLYTDPQVHSADGQSFGKGNLGQRGIDRFIQSHRCNAICRYLKLPSINANYAGLGTLPVTQYMKHTRVEVVHIGSFPRLERPAPLPDLSQPLIEPAKEETLCRFCTLL